MSEDLRDQLVTAGTELLTKIVMQEPSGDTSELYLQCEQLINAAESVKDSTHQKALLDSLTKINEQASITKENLETFRNVLNKYGDIETQAIVANAPPQSADPEVEAPEPPEFTTTYEDYEYEMEELNEAKVGFREAQDKLQHLANDDVAKRPEGQPMADVLLEISAEANKTVDALPNEPKATSQIKEVSEAVYNTIDLATDPSKKNAERYLESARAIPGRLGEKMLELGNLIKTAASKVFKKISSTANIFNPFKHAAKEALISPTNNQEHQGTTDNQDYKNPEKK